MELYRFADQSFLCEDRINPKKTIANPSPAPRSNPNLTLFINIPSNNPSTIAKINAISPLLASGFRCVLMIKLFRLHPKPLFLLQFPALTIEGL